MRSRTLIRFEFLSVLNVKLCWLTDKKSSDLLKTSTGVKCKSYGQLLRSREWSLTLTASFTAIPFKKAQPIEFILELGEEEGAEVIFREPLRNRTASNVQCTVYSRSRL